MPHPNPKNDNQHTPIEFCEASLKVRKNGGRKKLFVDYCVQHHWVPIKRTIAYEFLNIGLKNVLSQWCRVRGRKHSLEVEKVTKRVLDDLDVNVAMTVLRPRS